MSLASCPGADFLTAGNGPGRVWIGRGGGGGLGNFAATGAADGLAASSIMPDRCCRAGRGGAIVPPRPYTEKQSLSAGESSAVARLPSHGAAGMADFRHSASVWCLIDSYRTPPSLPPIDVALGPAQPIPGGGGRPPEVARADHHDRGARCDWKAEIFAEANQTGGSAPAGESGAGVSGAKHPHQYPGSGVRGTLNVPLLAREARERTRIGWKDVGVVRGDHVLPDHAEAATVSRGLA